MAKNYFKKYQVREIFRVYLGFKLSIKFNYTVTLTHLDISRWI